jgi:hypothetical protein
VNGKAGEARPEHGVFGAATAERLQAEPGEGIQFWTHDRRQAAVLRRALDVPGVVLG